MRQTTLQEVLGGRKIGVRILCSEGAENLDVVVRRDRIPLDVVVGQERQKGRKTELLPFGMDHYR